jgi:hypothetical protein
MCASCARPSALWGYPKRTLSERQPPSALPSGCGRDESRPYIGCRIVSARVPRRHSLLFPSYFPFFPFLFAIFAEIIDHYEDRNY